MRESLAQASGIGPIPPLSLPLSLPRSRTLPLPLTVIVTRAQAGAAAVPEQLAALLAALLADTVLEVRSPLP